MKQIDKDIYDNYFNIIQYLRDKNPATPALIQVSLDSFVKRSIEVTKFVLCPVVDKTPFLLRTLYLL